MISPCRKSGFVYALLQNIATLQNDLSVDQEFLDVRFQYGSLDPASSVKEGPRKEEDQKQDDCDRR